MTFRVLAALLCAALVGGCSAENSRDDANPGAASEMTPGPADASESYIPTEKEELASGVELVRSTNTGEFRIKVVETLGDAPLMTIRGTYNLSAGASQAVTTIAETEDGDPFSYHSRTINKTSYARISDLGREIGPCWIRGADMPRALWVGVFGIPQIAAIGHARAVTFYSDEIRVGFPPALGARLFPSRTPMALPKLPPDSEAQAYIRVTDDSVHYTLVGGAIASEYQRVTGKPVKFDYAGLALAVDIYPKPEVKQIVAPEDSAVISLEQAQAGECAA